MKEYKIQAAQLHQTGAGLSDDAAGTQIPAEEDGKSKSHWHMFSFLLNSRSYNCCAAPEMCLTYYIPADGPYADTPEDAVNLWGN